jgi:hypothetical protein
VRALILILVVGACGRSSPAKNLDLDRIRVEEARLRTDTVGGDPKTYGTTPGMNRELRDYIQQSNEGARFSDQATFVLVDAENTGDVGAIVTLGGDLRDGAGQTLGLLKPESLWIPAGERRTFALVESERKSRPTAAGAQITVRGAKIPEEPPVMRVEELHTFDDFGKAVVQGTLVNDVDRAGQAMVLASFRDATGKPMTRPFSLVQIGAKTRRSVQFVGPPGSKSATIYLGDLIY